MYAPMYKKLIQLTCILLCLSYSMFGQVGISTNNPQEELHIAGSGSTIRVDDLNSANKTNNYGIRPAAVHSNTNGDLILPPVPTNSEILFNGKDIIGSSIYLPTGLQGQAVNNQIYQTPSFTLTRNALVLIQYSMGFAIFNRIATQAVSDRKPRLVSNYLRLGNGTTVTSATHYARTGQSYTNSISPSSNYIPIGWHYNGATDALILPPGTYSFHMYAYLFNHGNINVKSSDSYSAIFGGSSREYLKITAFY